MPYEVHILEISVLAYSQRVAILKFLVITMLEMIMLSLLPKVSTTTESYLWVAYKKLSTRSNTCMKKRTRMFMFGLMECGPNLDLAIYSNYYPILRYLGKHFHGTTMKDTTIKNPWME